jgi:UDP-N-acetyl-D-mannosaminuronic acid dehydrogenase
MKGRKNSRILMIGLGQIGYSNADYMASQGNAIDGYDLNKSAIQRAQDAGIIAGEAEDFKDYDYYVVCISTHRPDDMYKPYMDGLYDVAKRIGREGKEGALVSIESTIAPGTTREVNKILGHRFHVAHFPHRF